MLTVEYKETQKKTPTYFSDIEVGSFFKMKGEGYTQVFVKINQHEAFSLSLSRHSDNFSYLCGGREVEELDAKLIVSHKTN